MCLSCKTNPSHRAASESFMQTDCTSLRSTSLSVSLSFVGRMSCQSNNEHAVEPETDINREATITMSPGGGTGHVTDVRMTLHGIRLCSLALLNCHIKALCIRLAPEANGGVTWWPVPRDRASVFFRCRRAGRRRWRQNLPGRSERPPGLMMNNGSGKTTVGPNDDGRDDTSRVCAAYFHKT